ncbi:MAG: hypothetical protein IT367_18140 [Candidatus Hydrogenedentes bacterium]|nr:hypothetical protein [Candidatus Hydrogenedentota bacterium]
MTQSFTWRIQAFENAYLDQSNRYRGTDLRNFGFPYAPGDYIPVDARYSAMAEHSQACLALQFYGRTPQNSGAISQ